MRELSLPLLNTHSCGALCKHNTRMPVCLAAVKLASEWRTYWANSQWSFCNVLRTIRCSSNQLYSTNNTIGFDSPYFALFLRFQCSYGFCICFTSASKQNDKFVIRDNYWSMKHDLCFWQICLFADLVICARLKSSKTITYVVCIWSMNEIYIH